MTPRGVHSIASLPPELVRSVRHGGWLEDWRLAAGLGALGLAVAVGWAVLAVRDRRAGRRHRHPVVRRAGLASLVTLLVLAGAGAGANAYAGYAPDLTTLRRTSPSSSAAGRQRPAETARSPGPAGTRRSWPRSVRSDPADRIPPGANWVYLPPGYTDPATRTAGTPSSTSCTVGPARRGTGSAPARPARTAAPCSGSI